MKKPVMWYYHKILCEFGYKFFGASKMYYKHLNIMCDRYGFNLYGTPIQKNNKGKYYTP